MLISDPRGLVSGPLMSGGLEQSVSSRMMLFTSDGRLRNKPEPSIVTHIKLKLATSTELKNPEGVKQWLIALAKALATHGLQKELHQLCEDLLGPTHSAARLTSKWAPKLLVRFFFAKIENCLVSLIKRSFKIIMICLHRA